ncbi:MAG: 16S rRNA (adenine(1518)-N(6)/adenine(1519)-N(6))-dimethyltransferase RsmA [Syntrophales bacterium]
MATAREILRKYNVRPRKRLGQSFLVDHNIMAGIVGAAGIRRDETVVEIGAGIGIMTAMIACRAEKVVAVEVDPALIKILEEELGECRNLEIVRTDILEYDFRNAAPAEECGAYPPRRLKVIGNIPYNISSRILFRLFAFREIISTMILMFQREVADRIMASPGSREYGILSVLVGMFAEPSRIMNVSRRCFFPPPEVDSTVLKIEFREKPLADLRDPGFFLETVKAAFSRRRKTLFNNLKSAFGRAHSDQEIEEVLKRAGIEGRRRGETLTVAEFGLLSNFLYGAFKEC